MPEHVLVGGDPHLNRVGTVEYCMCFGPCCFDGPTRDCLCEDCDCGIKGQPMISTRTLPVETSLEPLGVTSKPANTSSPQRTCVDCSNPVVRNGTRGRFPKKCPSCKGT